MSERTEPTEDIIKREIAAARRILQEDRHHAALSGLTERFNRQFPEEPSAPEGTPPPPKPRTDPAPPAAPKPSLWWGKQGES